MSLNIYVANILSKIFWLLGIVGVYIAFNMGGISLALKSLTIGLPLIVAPIFYEIFKKKNNILDESNSLKTTNFDFRILYIAYIIVLFLSVFILLISDIRPKLYYFFISILSIIILIEIYYTDIRINIHRYLIIFQIMILFITPILGQHFMYSATFGVDYIAHVNYFDIVSSSGHIQPEMGYYFFNPIYHILVSSFSTISNISNYHSGILVVSIASSSILILLYLMVIKFTNNIKLSLLSSLILSISRYFTFWTFNSSSQSFAFILIFFCVYYLFKSENRVKFKGLLIFTSGLIILTHTMSSLILFILMIFFKIAEWVKLSNERRAINIGIPMILLFLIALLSYWMFVSGFFNLSLIGLSNTMKYNPQVIPAPEFLKDNTSTQIWYISLLENTDLILSMFFVLIGILYIFQKDYTNLLNISKLGLILALFYYPTPIYLSSILRKSLLINRWHPFAEVFLVIIIAFSIYLLFQNSKNKQKMFVMFVFFIFVLFSVSNNNSGQDNPLLGFAELSGRPYTIQDVTVPNFLNKITEPSTVVTDLNYALYIRNIQHKGVKELLEDYVLNKSTSLKGDLIDVTTNEIYKEYKYFIFPEKAKIHGLTTRLGSFIITEDFIQELNLHNIIYTSGDIKIYNII